MKKLIQIVGILFLGIATISSCNSTSDNHAPDVVLQSFFKHLAQKDIDGASQFATTESKPTIQMIKRGFR